MRTLISIWIAKLAIIASKLLGKKGSSGAGELALKIQPSILKKLSSKVKKDIILVCGTNGKTTTNNLIYSLVKSTGANVVCNNVGANMIMGVANAFIDSCDIFGRLNADYAVLECDEASVRHIVNHLTPTKIVITNLFRDQVDRYGEVDATAKLLEEGISKVKDVTLILNADDPVSAHFGKKYGAVYYGIDGKYCDDTVDGDEGKYCIFCGEELSYNYHHYSQLGDYECEKCGFKRPKPHYMADNVSLDSGMRFEIHYGGMTKAMSLNYRGFYNIYNILAAFSVYDMLGLPIENTDDVLCAYKPQIGRMEEFNIGKKVILNLAKNPAGFNQAIDTVGDDKCEKDIIIAVNAKPSDGTDVSWINDVNFEKLNEIGCINVYAGGIEREKLSARLKNANVNLVETIDITKDKLSKIISSSDRPLYVLVNYTVLFDTQTILKELEGER